jgi:hypothetical protein
VYLILILGGVASIDYKLHKLGRWHQEHMILGLAGDERGWKGQAGRKKLGRKDASRTRGE